MDHPLIDLINAKIAAAEREGAFDNLAGAGRPLVLEGNPETQLFDRLMQESGAVPEAVTLRQRIAGLRGELLETSDRSARSRIVAEIAVLETKFERLKGA